MSTKYILFVILGTHLAPLLVTAAPSQVILIRHAEKPPEGKKLSPEGQKRAQLLVNHFKTNFPSPAAIFAMKPRDDNSSVRAIQTVTPLAESLGLEVKAKFTKKEVESLVKDILGKSKYDDKVVLICWEHDYIPTIVKEFGWDNPSLTWPRDKFDRVWVLNFTDGKVTSFQNLPQNLMPGDYNKCSFDASTYLQAHSQSVTN
jgi:hypothetical protein